MTPTLIADRELRAQHERWAGARERLWGGVPAYVPPVVVLAPPEPVNMTPFNFYATPSPRALIKIASLKHGIEVGRILSSERTVPVVIARDAAIALIHRHCEKSLPDIGRYFGRDHSTILHSLRKHTSRPLRHGKKRPARLEANG